MKIELETAAYNTRREGKPWIAKVEFPDSKGKFIFGDWVGSAGEAGLLILDGIEPGEIYARGQKDLRKRRNSAPAFYILGDDGKSITKVEAYKHYRNLIWRIKFKRYIDVEAGTEATNLFMALKETNDGRYKVSIISGEGTGEGHEKYLAARVSLSTHNLNSKLRTARCDGCHR